MNKTAAYPRRSGVGYFRYIFVLLLLISAGPSFAQSEPLPSWKQGRGEKRLAIIRFVDGVTNRGSTTYVPVENRVAVLGFKGTLVADEKTNEKDNVPYTGLVYPPMRELIAYLHDNGFTCWIVSSSSKDSLVKYAEATYGITSEHLISDVGHERKVTAMGERIDVRPIFAVGNTVNDYAMLQYSRQQPEPTMQLLIHHDDDKREVNYGGEAKVEQAHARGWQLVSMKNDWRRVFHESDVRERRANTRIQTATIPRLGAGQQPQIDGKLEESVYRRRPWLRPFVGMLTSDFGTLEAETSAFAAYDDTNLYVAFKSEEPNVQDLKIEGDVRDSNVYAGESVEVSILRQGETPGEENSAFYHFILNPHNVIYDEVANDKTISAAEYNPDISSGAVIGNNGWTAEMAIPWKEIGISEPAPGQKIYINFARVRDGAKKEYSSWSQFHSGFLETNRFGVLTLGK